MVWKATAALIVAVLVLGTAGCGGGGSSSGSSNATNAQSTTPAETQTQTQKQTTTPRPKVKPPKEPFARQVFDACQKRDAQLAVFTTRIEQQKPKGEFGDLARAFPPIETARLTAFEAITAPARVQSRFDELKAALRTRRDELAEWAQDNPTGTIAREVVRDIEKPGQRAQALVAAMKLRCSV